jgi:hypothetical protein
MLQHKSAVARAHQVLGIGGRRGVKVLHKACAAICVGQDVAFGVGAPARASGAGQQKHGGVYEKQGEPDSVPKNDRLWRQGLGEVDVYVNNRGHEQDDTRPPDLFHQRFGARV